MGNVTTGGSTTTPNSPQVTKTADTLLKGLRSTYKDGVDVYNKPLWVAPSDTTQSAWGQGSGFANNLIGSGGFGTGQRSAMDSLGGVFSGYGDVADNNGLTGAQSGAMAGLGGLGGQYAGLGNAYAQDAPGYQQLRNKIRDDTLTDVGSLFASNGRYGSDIMGESAAEGLGNALAGLDYGNYQNNVNNQYRSLDAQRGIFGDTFGMGQTGVGNQLAGLGGQAATAGQQFGMGQTALTNEGNAINSLGQIGAQQDASALAKRMANYDLFTRQNDADWEALARASSILGGTAGASGSTTSNSVPWWAALLGGAATGASIFG